MELRDLSDSVLPNDIYHERNNDVKLAMPGGVGSRVQVPLLPVVEKSCEPLDCRRKQGGLELKMRDRKVIV